MPPVGFEPTISAGDMPQTNALDRAVAWIGNKFPLQVTNLRIKLSEELWLHLHFSRYR